MTINRMTGPDCAVIMSNLINTHKHTHTLCCVFFPFILDVKFVGCTSRVGRVFTAGVGPCSPSRDAANLLPSIRPVG